MRTKNEEYKQKLLDIVKEFDEDNLVVKEYESVNLKSEGVLIRLLKFSPNNATEGEFKKGVLIPDFNGGFIDSSNFKDTVITPIGKVLKVHPSLQEQYSVGELVLVDFDKVRGTVPNPLMQLYMQALEARGVEAVEPEDTRPKIPRIEAMWMDYMFLRPWLFEPDDEDRLTYLLPTYEIKGSWDLETFLKT